MIDFSSFMLGFIAGVLIILVVWGVNNGRM